MSTAIATQEAGVLEGQQQYIVDQVEVWFSLYSITCQAQRTSQLGDLIQRCIQLKQSLECQEGTYIFRRSHPQMPFREENMRSLIDNVELNETVEYSVWPGLYKILQPGKWAVIEQEIVKSTTSSADIVSLNDDLEDESEDQLLEI
jgi:hypothetical protein